jgi:tyrosyl-tRNA synthetase
MLWLSFSSSKRLLVLGHNISKSYSNIGIGCNRKYVRKSLAFRNISSPSSQSIDSTMGNQCPSSFKSDFLQNLLERGFIHQCTDYIGLDEAMTAGKPIAAYLGFDATASSLHVGSLLQIMILRALQKSGHKPIILIGGGTTKVGDPSGKDESRQLLSASQIDFNAKSLSKVFEKFIKFGDGPTDAVMVDNATWLNDLNYVDFLRDYGRHFTINRMLSFESVKQRLNREQPLSFLEFNYLLLQSYDFVQLSRDYDVKLQIGGSDQWGNIVSGIELGRKIDQTSLYGLTAPLITTSSGAKMGKSEGGAVWLDQSLLSEYDYWQFWRNTSDADVIRFLKLFTDVSIAEIEEMSMWRGAQLNDAKIRLADEATMLLHSANCLSTIHATVQSVFTNGSNVDLSSLPLVQISRKDSDQIRSQGISVVQLLVLADVASSKNEARRLIAGGGARINDVKISDDAVITLSDFSLEDHGLKLSSGKKKHKLVKLS